jgi:hypothetical protein
MNNPAQHARLFQLRKKAPFVNTRPAIINPSKVAKTSSQQIKFAVIRPNGSSSNNLKSVYTDAKIIHDTTYLADTPESHRSSAVRELGNIQKHNTQVFSLNRTYTVYDTKFA